MNRGLIDKISLTLLVTIVLVIGLVSIEWYRNAFQTHKHWVNSVDINDNEIIASASDDQILLWEDKYCIDSLVEHSDAIKSIAFSHDNKLIVSASIDKTVKVWSVAESKVIRTFKEHNSGVNKVKFSQSDNYIISAGYDDKLFILDWRNGKRIKDFDIKHTGFSINQSDVLAYIDTTCRLNLFDLDSLSNVKTIDNYCGIPTFHPNGEILAIRTNDGVINIMNFNSGKKLSQLDINHGTHYGPFAFTPGGNNIIAGIWGGRIEVWDWKQKTLRKTLHGTPLNSINDFAFLDKNQLLSASGDQSVKKWNLQTGKLKLNIGDWLYKKQVYGVLSILGLIILISGFLGVYQNSRNRYSSWAVMLILSIWSLGILALGLLMKKYLVKYSMHVTWILTVLSGLAILSLYGSGLAFFTIPVALFLGYIKLKDDLKNREIIFPIVLNLILCGVLTSFIVSAGLWR